MKYILPESNLSHQCRRTGNCFWLVSESLHSDSLSILMLGLLLFFARTVDNSGNRVLEVDFLQRQDFYVTATFLLVQLAGKYLGNKSPQQAGLSILVMKGNHHPGSDSEIVFDRK